jgi:hypothetical protein
MNRMFRVPAGTMPRGDGLCIMSDAEYADKVDNSPPIGEAYAALGRIGNPTASACAYARVYGIGSRIGGTPRGEAPADGGSWRVRK